MNIMINRVCDLQCIYCFANKFVNQTSCYDENNITLDDFKKALDFATANKKSTSIGIIGGEPLLHPQFREIMELALNNKRISKVTLFTNGINLDRYIDVVMNNKLNILVNLNSPKDIGEIKYNKIKENLNRIVNEYGKYLAIGINVYEENMDFSFAIEMLSLLKLKKLRTSLVVPNNNSKRDSNAIDYFKNMKKTMLDLFKRCDEIDVIAYYDCNSIPICIYTDDEYEWLKSYVIKYENKICYTSNLIDYSICHPVIDILPNLTAVRCFGCSDLAMPIDKFMGEEDISAYFYNNVDNFAKTVAVAPKCKNCYSKHIAVCFAGCIAFKNKKIEKLRNLAYELDFN